MPNGKPGDHPYTDILIHGSSEYGEDVDAVVKALAKMPGFKSVSDEVANILWEYSPRFRPKKKERLVRTALAKLEVVRQKLLKPNSGQRP